MQACMYEVMLHVVFTCCGNSSSSLAIAALDLVAVKHMVHQHVAVVAAAMGSCSHGDCTVHRPAYADQSRNNCNSRF